MNRKEYIAAASRRLRGTWRSDKKKTESRWVFPKKMAGARLRIWKTMFGKNEWRFTANRVYGRFEGQRSAAPYRVLWANEWTAILAFGKGNSERAFEINFDDKWFYLLAGRDIVEYFRRVPNKRMQPIARKTSSG